MSTTRRVQVTAHAAILLKERVHTVHATRRTARKPAAARGTRIEARVQYAVFLYKGRRDFLKREQLTSIDILLAFYNF